MRWESVGQVCALLAALSWAFALVLFKRSGERITPLALNMFKNTVALVLLCATLVVFPDGFGRMREFQAIDFVILLISGIIGLAVADTLLFASLNLLGVSLLTIVECLYSPLIIFFSFLLLSEAIGPSHFVGTGLVLCSVVVSSRHKPPPDWTRWRIAVGVLIGAASMASMTFGIVLAKPVLEAHDFPLIWATTLRMAAGTAFLALFALASPRRQRHFAVFKPAADWRISVPGSVLGAYLAMIFWVAGFKYASASVAGILNQTSTIFALVLATVILKEAFTVRKFVAVMLAGSGVIIVTLQPF